MRRHLRKPSRSRENGARAIRFWPHDKQRLRPYRWHLGRPPRHPQERIPPSARRVLGRRDQGTHTTHPRAPQEERRKCNCLDYPRRTCLGIQHPQLRRRVQPRRRRLRLYWGERIGTLHLCRKSKCRPPKRTTSSRGTRHGLSRDFWLPIRPPC